MCGDTYLALLLHISIMFLVLINHRGKVGCQDPTVTCDTTNRDPLICRCKFDTPNFPSTQAHWKLTPLDLSSSLIFTHEFAAVTTSANSHCTGKCTGTTISRSNTAGEVELQISPLNGYFHGQIECQVDLAVGSLTSGNVNLHTFSDISQVEAKFQYEGSEAIGRVTGCMPSCTMLFSNENMVNQTCSNEVIARDSDTGTFSQSCTSPVSGDSLQLIVEIPTIDGTKYKTILLEMTTTAQETTTSLGPTTMIQTTQEKHESTFVSESTTLIMTESQTDRDVTEEIQDETTEPPTSDPPSENKKYLYFLFFLIIPVLVLLLLLLRYQNKLPNSGVHGNRKNMTEADNYYSEPEHTYQYDNMGNAYIVPPKYSKTHIQGTENKSYSRNVDTAYQGRGIADNHQSNLNNGYMHNSRQPTRGYQRNWKSYYTKDPYKDFQRSWYQNYTNAPYSDHRLTGTTSHTRTPNNGYQFGVNYNFTRTSNNGIGTTSYYPYHLYQK